MIDGFFIALLVFTAAVAGLTGAGLQEAHTASDCSHYGKSYVDGWKLTCEEKK